MQKQIISALLRVEGQNMGEVGELSKKPAFSGTSYINVIDI